MSDIVERLCAASNGEGPLSIGEHWNLEDEAADEIERLRAERDKLHAFKVYVHQRLDAMGVPHSVPESEHDKAGCRVGGRLDWVENALDKLRWYAASKLGD